MKSAEDSYYFNYKLSSLFVVDYKPISILSAILLLTTANTYLIMNIYLYSCTKIIVIYCL